jgi:hypothetical protein
LRDASFDHLVGAQLVPLAPGRFSMTNCWPSRSESHWPTRANSWARLLGLT